MIFSVQDHVRRGSLSGHTEKLQNHFALPLVHGPTPSRRLALLYQGGFRSGFDPKILHPKPSNRMFGHMHRVLNKVYLQNFLYGWAVNRETNLMRLLNL